MTGNALHNEEMEYHKKFGRIQHIDLMSRIEICYATVHLETQTVAYNLPCFQSIKRYVMYMVSHPHKAIFIVLIMMMAQIPSDLQGVGIKLKTTQPIIV